MNDYYHNVVELVLKYRENKDGAIRKAVIQLIPSMSTYDGDDFEKHSLHRAMSCLLQSLQKPTDRDTGKTPFNDVVA
jgi:FKBP12-rapamycin complex-associated protein